MNIRNIISRAGLRRDEGFTLIELLVVVVIIGVLAGIAIPVYIGIQNSAKDSAAQSDLATAKTAVVAYYAAKNSMPPTIDSASLKTWGYTSTTVTDNTSGTASIGAFCLKAPGGSSSTWYVTDTVAPTTTKPATGCR